MSSHIAKLTPKNSYNVAVLLIMAWNKNGEKVYQSVIYIYFFVQNRMQDFCSLSPTYHEVQAYKHHHTQKEL